MMGVSFQANDNTSALCDAAAKWHRCREMRQHDLTSRDSNFSAPVCVALFREADNATYGFIAHSLVRSKEG
jgi:hypothetical protein